jgi:hypothetical protein
MRTHYLAELSLSDKAKALCMFPNFDFYHVGQIAELRVEDSSDASNVEIVLSAVYSDPVDKRRALVTLRFGGVSKAYLPMFSPLCFLDELEIEDVKAEQLEGIGYRSKCYGTTQFDVWSRDLSIDRCEPL